MDKAKILQQEINKYEQENEYFDKRKFDDIQVLDVLFRCMESYNKINCEC